MRLAMPIGGAGSYSSAGAICPNLCIRFTMPAFPGRAVEGTRTSVQAGAAMGSLPRPVPVIAQGRNGTNGAAGRPHAAAAADREQGTHRHISASSSTSSASRDRAARLVRRSFDVDVKARSLHTPVTPFARDNAIDWKALSESHRIPPGNGAEGFALPMHVGESVSLTDEEQRKLVSFVVNRLGRVPVLAHVSDSGTLSPHRARIMPSRPVRRA